MLAALCVPYSVPKFVIPVDTKRTFLIVSSLLDTSHTFFKIVLKNCSFACFNRIYLLRNCNQRDTRIKLYFLVGSSVVSRQPKGRITRYVLFCYLSSRPATARGWHRLLCVCCHSQASLLWCCPPGKPDISPSMHCCSLPKILC